MTSGTGAPLRRLTNVEYDNTVGALLGETSAPSSRFLSDSDDESGFVGFRPVSPIDFERVRDAAEGIAARAVAPGSLEKLLPCASKGDDTACIADLVRSFGRRAFRRPLSAAESDALTGLYKAHRLEPGSTFGEGVQVVLEAVLQDPRFLYHRYLGQRAGREKPGDRVHLTSHEVAEQLSYFLWQAPPDPTLGQEADAGRLETVDQIEAQARRLLADVRARAMVSDFHEHWLHLGRLADQTRDAKAFPEFSEEVRRAMRDETRRLVTSVVFDGDGKLSTLLTTTSSFVNGPLAPVYGVTGLAKTADFAAATLPISERAGLLTEAAFLTSEPSLIRRGKFVRERLFCQPLTPPPANVNPVLENPDPALPKREQFAQHSSNPSCRGCHTLMDPIGFGFSAYDAIGKFRKSESGRAIDASGALAGTDVDGDFDGLVALTPRLARSEDVRQCYAQLWFRYALGRSTADGDSATIGSLTGRFASGGDDVRALILALVTSTAFTTRTIAAEEVNP